jgi:hypothetical protein
VVWIAIIIGLVLLMLGVWTLARKYLLANDEGHSAPWTLQDLRDLRAQGRLTETEFETLRAEMIGALKTRPQPADEKQDLGGEKDATRGGKPPSDDANT